MAEWVELANRFVIEKDIVKLHGKMVDSDHTVVERIPELSIQAGIYSGLLKQVHVEDED